jgi:hypothetical protein
MGRFVSSRLARALSGKGAWKNVDAATLALAQRVEEKMAEGYSGLIIRVEVDAAGRAKTKKVSPWCK